MKEWERRLNEIERRLKMLERKLHTQVVEFWLVSSFYESHPEFSPAEPLGVTLRVKFEGWPC